MSYPFDLLRLGFSVAPWILRMAFPQEPHVVRFGTKDFGDVARKPEDALRQAMAAGKSLAFQYLDSERDACSFPWPELVLPPHQGHFGVVNGMHALCEW